MAYQGARAAASLVGEDHNPAVVFVLMIALIFIFGGLAAMMATPHASWRERDEPPRRRPPDSRFGDWRAAPTPGYVHPAPVKPQPPPEPTRALPRTILFLDVETTGLLNRDRIVAFGGLKLRLEPPGEIVALHLVFNPQRRCAPRAVELHGFDDQTLSGQDIFDAYAAPLRAWCGDADLIVAHNLAFDLRFLNAAFAAQGLAALSGATHCTMLDYRARGEGSAALDSILPRLGLARRGRHGAIEDAWLCMQVFLWSRGLPWRLGVEALGDDAPANLRPAPPRRRRGRPRKGAAISEDAAGEVV